MPSLPLLTPARYLYCPPPVLPATLLYRRRHMDKRQAAMQSAQQELLRERRAQLGGVPDRTQDIVVIQASSGACWLMRGTALGCLTRRLLCCCCPMLLLAAAMLAGGGWRQLTDYGCTGLCSCLTTLFLCPPAYHCCSRAGGGGRSCRPGGRAARWQGQLAPRCRTHHVRLLPILECMVEVSACRTHYVRLRLLMLS